MDKNLKSADPDTFVAAVRDLFNLDPDLVHLNCMLIASHPKPVRDAICRYQEAMDWDPGGFFGERIDGQLRVLVLLEAVARNALDYLGVEVRERVTSHIALTESTTAGLSYLYNGLPVTPEQEILTTVHAFSSTRQALTHRNQADTIPVRSIELYSNPRSVTQRQVLETLENEIRPETRVLALTWVHSSTGVKLPIAKIGRLVESVNESRSEDDRIIFCVDGVHGFGVEDVTFDELACDFLIVGCHKWLFGPRGTGLIYGTPQAWRLFAPSDSVQPPAPSLYGRVNGGGSHTPGGLIPFAYRWAVADAFELHMAIGKKRIRDYTRSRATQLKQGLDKTRGVSLITPLHVHRSSGIVCCEIEGISARDAVVALREDYRILASVSSSDRGRHYVRFSPSILNTPSDIAEAIAAVERLVS